MPSPSKFRFAIGSSIARRASLQSCSHARNAPLSCTHVTLATGSRTIATHGRCQLQISHSKSQLRRANHFCSHNASVCLKPRQTPVHHSISRPQAINSSRAAANERLFSTEPPTADHAESLSYDISKEEAKRLVEIYPEEPEDSSDSYVRSTQSISTWNNEPRDPQPDEALIRTTSKELKQFVRELQEEASGLSYDEDRVWNLYQSIPEPRALHAKRVTKRLLRRLSTVKYKTRRGYLRYSSLISDLRAINEPVPLHVWNTAISYAGRCLKEISATHVENALNVWREMEQEAGIRGDYVTFNILFDAAVKARRFVLTDMIMEEMHSRELEFTRHFRTSLIHCYGLRGDADNIRKAYSEFINAGEIVDTAVINCVMLALFRCGDAGAAELVFERAKELHASKIDPQLPPAHWYERRRLGVQLSHVAQRQRNAQQTEDLAEGEDSAETASLKKRTSVAPDAITYRILVHHYAVTLGDIDRCAEIIDEMAHYELDVPGAIFLWLFHAFDVHGGVPYTSWTWRRLESTWTAFLDTLDASPVVERVSSPAISVSAVTSSNGGEKPFFDANENVRKWSRQPEPGTIEASRDPANLMEDEEDNDKINDNDQNGMSSSFSEDAVLFPNQSRSGNMDELSYDPSIYISRSLSIVIGKAFAKCSHLSRTAQIWAELKTRWTPETIGDMEEVESELAHLFPEREEFFRGIVRQEESKLRR